MHRHSEPAQGRRLFLATERKETCPSPSPPRASCCAATAVCLFSFARRTGSRVAILCWSLMFVSCTCSSTAFTGANLCIDRAVCVVCGSCLQSCVRAARYETGRCAREPLYASSSAGAGNRRGFQRPAGVLSELALQCLPVFGLVFFRFCRALFSERAQPAAARRFFGFAAR